MKSTNPTRFPPAPRRGIRFPRATGHMLRLLAGAIPFAGASHALAQYQACCLPHGACAMATVLECRNMGGVWQGNGSNCATVRCPRVYPYVGSAVAIPDGGGITGTGQPAIIPITVPDSFAVSAAYLELQVTHPRQSDLRVVLTHVNTGHSVVLIDRPGMNSPAPFGFTASNLGPNPAIGSPNSLLFDDGASVPYAYPQVPLPGIANVTGTYRPIGSLSVFAGESAAGLWQVSVTDGAAGATGQIVEASLVLADPGDMPVLSPGAVALTVQGMIPDTDTCLLGLSTGLGGALSYNSTYTGASWSGQLCGTYQGQPTCLTYSGGTQSVTASSATWTVSGQVGAAAVSGSGSAAFTGAGPYSIAVQETLHVGSRTFTLNGTYTGTPDAQGRVNVDSGTTTIADDANPGQGGNPGWGNRWVWDNVNQIWVSMFRAWDPWYGWQDYAYNESYFTPLQNAGTFAMAQNVHRSCYVNCDASTTAPVLNVADFTCFLQKYANADPYANCDGSTTAPTLNVADFTCFLQKYANGCP